eukprot:9220916-Ditylum_brightwellii.AAC.1
MEILHMTIWKAAKKHPLDQTRFIIRRTITAGKEKCSPLRLNRYRAKERNTLGIRHSVGGHCESGFPGNSSPGYANE